MSPQGLKSFLEPFNNFTPSTVLFSQCFWTLDNTSLFATRHTSYTQNAYESANTFPNILFRFWTTHNVVPVEHQLFKIYIIMLKCSQEMYRSHKFWGSTLKFSSPIKCETFWDTRRVFCGTNAHPMQKLAGFIQDVVWRENYYILCIYLKQYNEITLKLLFLLAAAFGLTVHVQWRRSRIALDHLSAASWHRIRKASRLFWTCISY